MINIHEKFILQLEEELQQIKFILIVIINICIYIYISKSETQSFSSRNL